jgi:hypothetical protein
MAATVLRANRAGRVGATAARNNAIVVLAETNQLTASAGRLDRVVVWNVGTTFTIDIYDTATAVVSAATHIWAWVSADGKGIFNLNLPLSAGLYVVTTGTPGGVNVTYD